MRRHLAVLVFAILALLTVALVFAAAPADEAPGPARPHGTTRDIATEAP